MNARRTFSKDDTFAEYHGEISTNFIRLGIVVRVGGQDVVQRGWIGEHESVPLYERHMSALLTLETKYDAPITDAEQAPVPDRAAIFLRPVGVWTSWIFVYQRAEVAPQGMFRRRARDDAQRREKRRDKDAVNPVGDKGCGAKSHASTGVPCLLVSLFTFCSRCE